MTEATIAKWCMAVFTACITAVLLYAVLNGGLEIRRKIIFFDSLKAATFLSVACVWAGLFRRRV
jgi:hypothetical protein